MSKRINLPNRKSIRLQLFDYSSSGLYYVTIMTYHRKHLFGKILNEKMIHNEAGFAAIDFWRSIPKHFQNVTLHEFVVMPNHIHGIIELHQNENTKIRFNKFQKMIPGSISAIVKGFKIGVTKWIRSKSVVGIVLAEYFLPENDPNVSPQPVWQRNFYEHVIRNENSYQRISNYIINNQKKWAGDRFNRKSP